MIVLHDELMSKHTTFRIGGPVETMLIPESEDELINTIRDCRAQNQPYRILGNGSNLLVSDQGIKECVINNERACKRLEIKDNDIIYAGSSVKIQLFIRFCVNHGREGYEYLFSVPAAVGGAIYMNAGRGQQFNKQISDHLVSVRVFNGVEVIDIPQSECEFSYRSSIFHKRPHWVILGAYFKPPIQRREEGEAKIKERMKFTKEVQDYNYPTAGSVFKSVRHELFWLVFGLKSGKAQYSAKTTNWINNMGGAKAADVLKLIKVVEVLNLLTFKRAIREIICWE